MLKEIVVPNVYGKIIFLKILIKIFFFVAPSKATETLLKKPDMFKFYLRLMLRIFENFSKKTIRVLFTSDS